EATLEEHLRGGSAFYECEYRLLANTADPLWLLDHGKVVNRDARGAPLQMMGAHRDITARKEADAALRASRERYALAIRAGKVGVWDFRIDTEEFHADELRALLGYTEDELGTQVGSWLELMPEEDREETQRLVRAHLAGHIPRYECEHRIRRKNGSTAWFFCSGSVVERVDGKPARLMGTSTDITDLKNAEIALRESEGLYRLLAENSTDIITRHLPDGTYLYVSPAIRRLTGNEPEELIGHTAFEYVHPDDVPILREASLRALGGEGSAVATYRRRRKDGTYYWAESTGAVVRDAATGEVSDIVVVTRDVTARIEAERAAKEREQQLMQADKMASLGVLVSGVAHEINNPNAFILNNLDLLELVWNGALPVLDRYREEHGAFSLAGLDYARLRERMPLLLAGMRDGARRIKLIVEELRGFARQEPDGIIESVNLNHVINSATMLLANMLSKATDHFVFTPEENLPPVHGSFRRLEQVVINLLQNACQALTSRDQHLHVSTQYRPGTRVVRLVVEDGGVGIPAEAMPRITDPFFTTKRDAGGTGLGLSISATIIREHGGVLRFDSQTGHGAVATVILPAGHAATGDVT
ncbi:MAG TPA: PAS domain-containing protein, partial [Candidatus Hydrogenedentes bacterium]|nr:PAS domain-containing protein [Candidatus Hydrogenedentota bacterium]